MSDKPEINVIETAEPADDPWKIVDIRTKRPWVNPNPPTTDELPKPNKQLIRALKDMLGHAEAGRVQGMAVVLFSEEHGWATYMTDTMLDVAGAAATEVELMREFLLDAHANVDFDEDGEPIPSRVPALMIDDGEDDEEGSDEPPPVPA